MLIISQNAQELNLLIYFFNSLKNSIFVLHINIIHRLELWLRSMIMR